MPNHYRKPVPHPEPKGGDIPDSLFEKVTVSGTPRWMWRTPGGHGILVPQHPSVVETPEGKGMCTVSLPGFTVGVLNLTGEFGTDESGRMFKYELVEGWPNA